MHKYNLGIIGNCSYLAYIDNEADVKWLCMPRFDSSFVFGSLLDKNCGNFYIKPFNKNYKSNQYYKENTNILITEFITDEDEFRVIDFAPRFYQYDRYFKPMMLFRKIELIKGNPFIKIACNPTGIYGNVKPEVVLGSNHIRYLNIGPNLRLTTDIPLTYILEEKPFILNDKKYLAFTYGPPLEAPLVKTAEDFLEETEKYWLNWVKSTSIANFHQKEIIRSALVLKLHQFEDTGGIIASGTTSLPESNNSGRNWDYRYCWLRDTYYTLMAFNNIGHFDELEKYFYYIQNIIYSHKASLIAPLYTLSGDKVPFETELNLDGYCGNKPIRIGNNATSQIQNDVYGQLLVSLLPLYTDNRLTYFNKLKSLNIIKQLLNKIKDTINKPDSGIWEFRNKNQYHLYTNLFHWAGSMACIKIGKHFNDAELESLAKNMADQAAENIEKCYNSKLKAYTQAIDSDCIDASSLQLIIMKYLDPNSEKAKNQIEAVEKHLKIKDALLYRYNKEDDFGKPENAFLICSFWYIEALAITGRLDDAIKNFEEVLKYTNHLGLLSEDAGIDGSQWGNFPQTYSHVGLMNAAYKISQKIDNPIFLQL